MANIPDVFGIDLGDYTLKVVDLKISGKNIELQSIGSTEVKANIVESLSEKGLDELVKKTKELLKSSKIRTKNCVASIPESSIYSRLVTLPSMPDSEIDEAIHWAAKPLMPVDIEEMNVSYSKIDEYNKDGKKFVNWYVVGANKSLIQKYLNFFSKCGLKLLAVETESLAIARMFTVNYNIYNDSMIVDIGAENTNIIVERNGSILFSQTQNVGSNAINKVISSDYGVSDAEAEEYKKQYGLDFNQGEGKIASSIAPVVDQIIAEINKTIAYYKNKITGNGLSKVYITGGGSSMPLLDSYMNQKLSIEVELVDIFKKVKINGRKEKELKELNRNSFNIATGLALKGYSLDQNE